MEAVVFIGLQGSGKTTFYRERFLYTHLRISLDILKTRGKELRFLKLCLETGQRFVIDNTNPQVSDRERYLELLKQSQFRITGYYFPCNVQQALERNRLRSAKHVVPDKGILATNKKLVPPTFPEGFHSLYFVYINPDGSYRLEEQRQW